MAKHLMVLLALIFATTSCVLTPKAPEPNLPSKLVDQTVALVAYKPGHMAWGTYCTGVWIDSKTILTAYHCAAAAKIMSLPEEEQDDAEELGQSLSVIGTPIFYAMPGSFNNILHAEPMNYYHATVVGGDGKHDLALIEVLGSPLAHRSAVIANSEPAVGDDIEVMGHPAGIEFTYAHGYVSAYRSGIDSDILDIQGPFMQINAGISGGNSGGGVFNSKGELVGIISFVSPKAQVQGFTVPVGSIKRLLKEYNKKEKPSTL